MKGLIGLFSILVVAGSVFAVTPAEIKALRKVRKIDKNRVEFLYQFEDEYVTLAAQAAGHGSEAARAWAKFDKKTKAVAVLARSPFGGGESVKSYWPIGVKSELLKNVVEPLKKAGIKKVVLTDMPEEEGKNGGSVKKTSPKAGFPEGCEFVLVIGFHHEPVPHRGSRRTVAGKVVYSRSSRVNAWAILFHAPTATAFWCASATTGVDRSDVDDPLNVAAERAVAALDFTGIGTDNIPGYIKKLAEPEGFNALDIAATLAQTQRADAAEAIVRAATSVSAFKNSVRVVRYVSQKGVVQDYRTGREAAEKRKYVEMAQPVMMRVLLLEHLRGFRGLQPCAMLARVPRERDFQIPRIGRQQVGRLMPLSADDEIVLIAELVDADFSFQNRKKRTKELLWRTRHDAVGNLGRCRVHIDEAKVIARLFAERKITKPKPPRAAYLDEIGLKEAGIDALKELNKPVKPKVR